MTTTQSTTTIGELLIERRDTNYKSVAARTIGVSRQIYDAWETGHFIPGDEWAGMLAIYLNLELEEIVLRLFNDRIRKYNPDAEDSTLCQALHFLFDSSNLDFGAGQAGGKAA